MGDAEKAMLDDGAEFPRSVAGLLALHSACNAKDLWKSGVSLLRETMPGHHYLMALPVVGLSPMFLRTTLPVPDEPDYWARLNRLAPLEKMIAMNKGKKTGRMSDDVPMIVMRLTPFYRKFMKPEGWRYAAGMFFWEGDRFLGQFSQNRTAAQGDFTDREMAMLMDLHPQFETAIRRVLALDCERSGRRSLEAVFHRSPLPTAIVDWDLGTQFCNRAAAEISALWKHGEQVARSMKPCFELPAEIATAVAEMRIEWELAAAERDRVGSGENCRCVKAGGTECTATIRRLDSDSPLMVRPHFLIEFSVPTGISEAACAVSLLAQLTCAEREIARLAARGLDNKQIAEVLFVTVSTVRTHLRHIFAKLGIQNRARLAPIIYAVAEDPFLAESTDD